MAMTLRLTDEQDKVLTELARTFGVSKQDAVVRAIQNEAARTRRRESIDRVLDAELPRYADALERLGR